MDVSTWTTISRLLDDALDRPPSERDAWLSGLGPEYAALLPKLRELLVQSGSMSRPAFLATLPKFELDAAAEPHGVAVASRAGTTVGPYRLVRVIARGGQGAVWLADRFDGLLTRPVALKLPHGLAFRPGLAERMARERDILSTLNHPHIARLYDAGVSADGEPYLALEYVDGAAIDQHANARGLSVAARVRLFLQVIRAVAFAHGQLVIHRDLKPSNILVTPEGYVRLLDFGIAKLLAEDRADSTLTVEAGRAMTVAYASPEQVRQQPLGVASDVYSLGVVLYELLTGVRPYRLERESAALLEEAVLTQEPRRASEAAVTPAIRKALSGELDTILAKALKKDPASRYASAEALADDLSRHLDGRPVLAQPDTRTYRLRKFVTRHRVGVTAAAVAVAAILVGAAVAAVGYVRATRAEAVARQESTTARRVSDFLTGLFGASDPNARTTTTLRELLDRAATRIERDLKGEPAVQAGLFETISHVYGSLGLHQIAVDLAGKALALDAAAGRETIETSDALETLGRSAWALGDLDAATSAFERGLTIRARVKGEQTLDVAEMLNLLGGLHGQRERFDDAIAAHTRALAIQRRVRGPEDVNVTNSLRGLAIVYSRRDDHRAALDHQEQALAIYRRTFGDDHAITASGFEDRARYLQRLDRLDEARASAERALEIKTRLLGSDHTSVAFSRQTLAEILVASGQHDAALPHLQDALRIREANGGDKNPRTAETLEALGLLQHRLGDVRVARRLIERAAAIFEASYGPDHSRSVGARRHLSTLPPVS